MGALGAKDYGSDSQPRTGAFEYREPRKRVYLNGKLVYGEGMYSSDCLIRDVSPGGAKIVVRRTQMIPRSLYLIAVKERLAHRAEVVWLNVPARGLKFVDTYRLNDNIPEDAKFLRPLWENLCARGMSVQD